MIRSLSGCRTRRRSVCGLSLTETLVGATVMVLSLGGMAAATMYLLKGVNRNLTDSPLQSSGRAGIDEVLYQVRGASGILSYHTFSDGTTITTDNYDLVVQAPAYSPSSSSVIVRNSTGTTQYDTIGFTVDRYNRLLEYVDPASGSYRPARTAYVVSKNVANKIESPTAAVFSAPATTSGSNTVTLSQTVSLTSSGPVTFSNVKYAPVSNSLSSTYTTAGSVPYTGSTPTYDGATTITVPNVPAGNNVTVYVTYTTTASMSTSLSSPSSATLAGLSQLNVELDLASTDARGSTRTVTSNGSAYLHNYGRSL